MLFPTRFRVALAGFAVAGGLAAAAVLGPAGPAVGQASPPVQLQIQVNSPATLVAKGAAINLSVTASCSGAQTPGFIVVGVSERVAGSIAYGSAETTISCTGASQLVELVVIAGSTGPSGNSQGPSKAFAKGSAIATGNIQGCSGPTCFSQQVQPTITISK